MRDGEDPDEDAELRRAVPPAWPLLLHVICLVGCVPALFSALAGVPYRAATATAAVLLAASGAGAIIGKRSILRARGLSRAQAATDDPEKRAALDRGNAYLIGTLLVVVGIAWLAISLVGP